MVCSERAPPLHYPAHFPVAFIYFFVRFLIIISVLSRVLRISQYLGSAFSVSHPGVLRMHRNCCFQCKSKQSKTGFLLSPATKTGLSAKHPSVIQNVSKEKASEV